MYDECTWHGHEPAAPNDYKDCFECGHIWRTEADFLADVQDLFERLGLNRRPTASLRYCPLCSHDF